MKAIIAGIFVAFLAVASTDVFARGLFGTVDDLVVLYCQRSDGVTGTVFASHASSSSGSPVVSVGLRTSCAEELAKLTNVGFQIQSVVPADSSFVVYTLTRK